MRSYPSQASKSDFEYVTMKAMTTKFENVRRASPDPLFYLPWDERVDTNFAWDKRSVAHDFARVSVQN